MSFDIGDDGCDPGEMIPFTFDEWGYHIVWMMVTVEGFLLSWSGKPGGRRLRGSNRDVCMSSVLGMGQIVWWVFVGLTALRTEVYVLAWYARI